MYLKNNYWTKELQYTKLRNSKMYVCHINRYFSFLSNNLINTIIFKNLIYIFYIYIYIYIYILVISYITRLFTLLFLNFLYNYNDFGIDNSKRVYNSSTKEMPNEKFPNFLLPQWYCNIYRRMHKHSKNSETFFILWSTWHITKFKRKS